MKCHSAPCLTPCLGYITAKKPDTCLLLILCIAVRSKACVSFTLFDRRKSLFLCLLQAAIRKDAAIRYTKTNQKGKLQKIRTFFSPEKVSYNDRLYFIRHVLYISFKYISLKHLLVVILDRVLQNVSSASHRHSKIPVQEMRWTSDQ